MDHFADKTSLTRTELYKIRELGAFAANIHEPKTSCPFEHSTAITWWNSGYEQQKDRMRLKTQIGKTYIDPAADLIKQIINQFKEDA